jgi:hypothetical protein
MISISTFRKSGAKYIHKLLEKVEQNIQDNPSASGNLLTNANTFIFHRLFSLLVSYTREKMYIQGIPIASEIGAFLRNDP